MTTPTRPPLPNATTLKPSPASKQQQSNGSHLATTPNTQHLAGLTSSTSTPRSVPSPAVARAHSHAAKTPAQHASKSTLGSTPMAPSLSQMSARSVSDHASGTSAGLGIGGLGASGGGGGTDMARGLSGLGVSPNMLNFASPAALAGLDLGTPSLLENGLGGVGSQPMGISLSDLGLGSGNGMGRRNEDEERRGKLDGVLGRLIGKRKRGDDGRKRGTGLGRVSDEGVRRIGKWVGFDVEVEAKWEGKEFEGNRPITIAGRNAVLIDLNFKDHVPSRVEVAFASEDQTVLEHQADAAKVLMQDLRPDPGSNIINTKLDRFAANLEALVKLDRLSSPQLNCIEAVTGVYKSLRRLYEHEKKAAGAIQESQTGHHAAEVEHEVICKRSGRPSMHANRRVGLSLQYWADRTVGKQTTASSASNADAMLIDSRAAESPREVTEDKAFYLEITAEASEPNVFPPLRNTSDWISERIIKPAEEANDPTDLMSNKPIIDWLDPEQTYLDISTSQPDAMPLDGETNRRLPEARFVARLHPPLTMPYNVAGQILQSVGLTAMPNLEPLGSYEHVLLRGVSSQNSRESAEAISSTRSIFVPRPDQEKDVTHAYTLSVAKPEYAYKLEEVPFAHPRQIVQILPILRQWAHTGTLLRTTFVNESSSTKSAIVARDKEPTSDSVITVVKGGTGINQTALSDLLAIPSAAEDTHDKAPLPIDISLSTANAQPSLVLFFPISTNRLVHINVTVLADAEIAIAGQDVVRSGHAGNKQEPEAPQMDEDGQKNLMQIKRAGEICGDIGVWIEWLRTKYA